MLSEEHRIFFESCPIDPWIGELVARMNEAQAQQTNVVNLSFSHPRGFFPNQILRRPRMLAYLKEATRNGWLFNTEKAPPELYPADHLYMPHRYRPETLEYCPLEPFEREIEKRTDDAKKVDGVPLVDLTCHHPRGGIPPAILTRLHRRKNLTWRQEAEEKLKELLGQANKDEAFAKTQEERAEGLRSKGTDDSNLLSAAKELRARASETRAQAEWLKKELAA